ncbi:hypothetical protein FRC03_007285 [Tulasnella sp. 419]|nr:hypothetical protein FRC03_007285 [Tulasnella sp. 419]
MLPATNEPQAVTITDQNVQNEVIHQFPFSLSDLPSLEIGATTLLSIFDTPNGLFLRSLAVTLEQPLIQRYSFTCCKSDGENPCSVLSRSVVGWKDEIVNPNFEAVTHQYSYKVNTSASARSLSNQEVSCRSIMR